MYRFGNHVRDSKSVQSFTIKITDSFVRVIVPGIGFYLQLLKDFLSTLKAQFPGHCTGKLLQLSGATSNLQVCLMIIKLWKA